MSQDDTSDLPVPDVPPKAAPEDVTLRAQPRAVTRLNRRMLAALAGGLSVAVLGALMWSLQPQRRNASESTAVPAASALSFFWINYLPTIPSCRLLCRNSARRCRVTWADRC